MVPRENPILESVTPMLPRSRFPAYLRVLCGWSFCLEKNPTAEDTEVCRGAVLTFRGLTERPAARLSLLFCSLARLNLTTNTQQPPSSRPRCEHESRSSL